MVSGFETRIRNCRTGSIDALARSGAQTVGRREQIESRVIRYLPTLLSVAIDPSRGMIYRQALPPPRGALFNRQPRRPVSAKGFTADVAPRLGATRSNYGWLPSADEKRKEEGGDVDIERCRVRSSIPRENPGSPPPGFVPGTILFATSPTSVPKSRAQPCSPNYYNISTFVSTMNLSRVCYARISRSFVNVVTKYVRRVCTEIFRKRKL